MSDFSLSNAIIEKSLTTYLDYSRGLYSGLFKKSISEFGSAEFVGKTEYAQHFHISLPTEKIARILKTEVSEVKKVWMV